MRQIPGAGIFLQRYATSGAVNHPPVNTIPGSQTIYGEQHADILVG